MLYFHFKLKNYNFSFDSILPDVLFRNVLFSFKVFGDVFRYLSFCTIQINFNEVIKHVSNHWILRNILMLDEIADNMIYTVGFASISAGSASLTEPASDENIPEKNFPENFELSSICHTFIIFTCIYTVFTTIHTASIFTNNCIIIANNLEII